MFGPTLQQADRKWYAGWSQEWWYHNFCQWESDDHPFQLEQWSKEVGKQFSKLRMTFTCINTLNTQWRVVWDFTPHKNTFNERWCETLHHIRIHSMKGGVRLWCETLHDIRIHLMRGGVRLWCETLHRIRIHLMKGGVRLWCETLHHIRIHSMKGGVRLRCETFYHIRIHSIKGGVRLWCETLRPGWPRVWGGSRSTKPCGFPCKVASAGDERYLLCAAVAAAVVWFPLCVLQRVVVPVRIVLCVSWICGCRSHWNSCMSAAWAMFWWGSRSTKPCVFLCKVAASGDERYLMCAARAAAVVPDAIGSSSGCVCVRSSMRFLNLWLQTALEWVHDCCHLVLPCVCREMQVCYGMLRNVL